MPDEGFRISEMVVKKKKMFVIPTDVIRNPRIAYSARTGKLRSARTTLNSFILPSLSNHANLLPPSLLPLALGNYFHILFIIFN
jgi:hypothetical protein